MIIHILTRSLTQSQINTMQEGQRFQQEQTEWVEKKDSEQN